jgi:hypothetical protein
MDKSDYVKMFESAILNLEHVHQELLTLGCERAPSQTLLRTLARLQALLNHVDYNDHPFEEKELKDKV